MNGRTAVQTALGLAGDSRTMQHATRLEASSKAVCRDLIGSRHQSSRAFMQRKARDKIDSLQILACGRRIDVGTIAAARID